MDGVAETKKSDKWILSNRLKKTLIFIVRKIKIMVYCLAFRPITLLCLSLFKKRTKIKPISLHYSSLVKERVSNRLAANWNKMQITIYFALAKLN